MPEERSKMLDMLDRQTRLLAHQPAPPPLPTIDPEAIEGASKKKLRKLLRRLLGGVAILIFTYTPSPTWAAGDFTTFGVQSCGKWSEQRRTKGPLESALRIWLAGYMTGVAGIFHEAATGATKTEAVPDLFRGIDADSVALWMDNYCQAHPLEDLLDGARKLVDEMIQRQ